MVSFCNMRGEARGGPPIAALTLRSDERWLRWIPLKNNVPLVGVTGICLWGEKICATHQGGTETLAGFVLLDPTADFEPTSEGVLPPDPHSACAGDSELYFAITGKDRVYSAAYDDSLGEWRTQPYWKFPNSSGRKDENHINAVGHVDGELCVSGFEHKKNESWDSATRGFVYNVDREEYMMRGVNHPHSFKADSSTVWTCESRENKLRSRDGDEIQVPSTYLRGLAIDDDHFYVGSSKQRPVSKSTGKVNQNVRHRNRGSCCVYRLSKESKEPELVFDFSHLRDEIYDIFLFSHGGGTL